MKKEVILFLLGIVCLLFSWWSFYNLRYLNNCGCPDSYSNWLSYISFGVVGNSAVSCVLPVCRTTRDPYEFYFYFWLLGVLLILSSIISVFQKLVLRKK